ncbi:MAG: sensor histidine kinase [Polyangiaceae bacterium]|nr:sensor histidine kinase [Polyangiaceae bacterium]
MPPRWMASLLSLEPAVSPALDLSDDETSAQLALAGNLRALRRAALIVGAVALVGLALDPLFHRPGGAALRPLWAMRLAHGALGAGALLALATDALGRRPLAVGAALVALGGGALGAAAGALGTLAAPWVHTAHASLLSAYAVSLRLGARAAYAAALPASVFAGFVAASARPLGEDAPTLAFMAAVAAVVAGTGHAFRLATTRALVAARGRERAGRELAQLNATLESRVATQTSELRELAAHLETAREDERARISRELHDELGQELTALRYALSFLRQRYEREPGSVRPNLDELDALLGRAVATTRQLVSELRPRVLDDLGLPAGVEWLVRQTGERAGLAWHLAAPADLDPLDTELRTAAFRIVQESLTNVARHARASRVEVELAASAAELRLTVRDDGVGLPPAGQRAGMGLFGMRERVRALGGVLELTSAPGAGTTVEVRLPRPAAAPEARP